MELWNTIAWVELGIVEFLELDYVSCWSRVRVIAIKTKMVGLVSCKEMWVPYDWLAPFTPLVIEGNEYRCCQAYLEYKHLEVSKVEKSNER